MPTPAHLLLLVAPPDLIRDALLAYLRTLPQFKVLDPVADLAGALAGLDRPAVTLALLDTGVSADWADLLRRLRAGAPAARWVVMLDAPELEPLARQAGADAVWLKGAPTAWLTQILLDDLAASSADALDR